MRIKWERNITTLPVPKTEYIPAFIILLVLDFILIYSSYFNVLLT